MTTKTLIVTDPTPEDYALLARYRENGKLVVQQLVDAYAEADPAKGAATIRQLYVLNDETLWTMVLGEFLERLTAMVKFADRVANVPVGDDTSTSGWYTAVGDNLAAAVENRDWDGYARMSVDGLLRALREDSELKGYTVDLQHIMRSLMDFEHPALLVVTAEVLRRLFNERSP